MVGREKQLACGIEGCERESQESVRTIHAARRSRVQKEEEGDSSTMRPQWRHVVISTITRQFRLKETISIRSAPSHERRAACARYASRVRVSEKNK